MFSLNLEEEAVIEFIQGLFSTIVAQASTISGQQQVLAAVAVLRQEQQTMSEQLTAKIDQLSQKASNLEQRAIAAEQRDEKRGAALASLQQKIDQQTGDLKLLQDQLAALPQDTTAQENAVQAVIDELTNVSDQIDKIAADPVAADPNATGAGDTTTDTGTGGDQPPAPEPTA
jgi:chromosome segregation ATPase